jgi:hypothetical protein
MNRVNVLLPSYDRWNYWTEINTKGAWSKQSSGSEEGTYAAETRPDDGSKPKLDGACAACWISNSLHRSLRDNALHMMCVQVGQVNPLSYLLAWLLLPINLFGPSDPTNREKKGQLPNATKLVRWGEIYVPFFALRWLVGFGSSAI